MLKYCISKQQFLVKVLTKEFGNVKENIGLLCMAACKLQDEGFWFVYQLFSPILKIVCFC